MTPFGTAFMDGLALRPLWKFLAKPDIDAATAREREACAKVCDAEADSMETAAQRAIENGEHDEVSAIRSTAWKLSVAANRIRARSNAEVRGDAPPYGAASLSTDVLCNGGNNEQL